MDEVRGPFVHWTELGVSREGGSSFFRGMRWEKRSTDEAAAIRIRRVRDREVRAVVDSSGTTLDFSCRRLTE
jgi:hypothetical protein